MKKHMLMLSALLFALIAFSACENNTSSNTIEVIDCHGNSSNVVALNANNDSVLQENPFLSYVRAQHIGENNYKITHHFFENCERHVRADFRSVDNDLRIVEHVTGNARADCECNFDAVATLKDAAPGVYHLTIKSGSWTSEYDLNLTYDVDTLIMY
ncbi:MAG: hypothetical protein Q4D14_04660 [Bacteroidales bacterium]|nr:hypothetical protein [Bacteroidales bacterium]